MKTNKISFTGYNQPNNFKKIDEYILRSAQPQADEIKWLKNSENITDIVNFRTLYVPAIDFNEEELAKELNIKYHQIPTISKQPTDENVKSFFNIIDEVKNGNRKALIHCKAGADRTGFYSLLYMVSNGIDNFENAAKEMLNFGHNNKLYPNLIDQAKEFLKHLK